MNFSKAIQICIKKSFNSSGRASRAEYWYFFLFCSLIGLLVTACDAVFLGIKRPETGIFSLLAEVILFLPAISVTIRRLHDTNKPGWYMFILLLIVPILLIEYLFGADLRWMAMFGVFGTLAFCVWLFQSSDEGENQYGSEPTT